MKQFLIFLFITTPFFVCAQQWQIGAMANYGRGNLKIPYVKKLSYNKGVYEYSLGLAATKFFCKKIGLHFNLNLNNFWIINETEGAHPIFNYDPNKDVKYSLNYLNPNVKLLYYKNNTVDGLSIGLGTYIHLFQTKNYEHIYHFRDRNNIHNTFSLGYFCRPVKNLMAELEFVSNITALGSFNYGDNKIKWEDKYWKYGLLFSVTYHFLSLPNKKVIE